MDELTHNIHCYCGKRSYECDCRNGISKIVGSMIDRYFELAQAPIDPVRIWQWVGNLNFHRQCQSDQNKSVQVIRENYTLRQGIIAHVFGLLTDRKEIFNIKVEKFDGHPHSHSGFNLWRNDYKFLLDLAFKTDNVDLWASFLVSHQCYKNKEEQGSDDLRAKMRQYALSKPAFMREWARYNNTLNWSLVTRNWFGLRCEIVWILLLPWWFPPYRELAALQCESKHRYSETVLYASCLEILRAEGNLECVILSCL